VDDEKDGFPITRDARKRRAAQIERFTDRQRWRRDWISFIEIADWFSCESRSIRADETKRADALNALEKDLLAGYFEEHDRSRVLFLPPDMRRARLTRDELREVIKHNLDGCHGRSQYLLNCWLPRTMVERFFARRQLGNLPAHWSLGGGRATTAGEPTRNLLLGPQCSPDQCPQTVQVETRESPPTAPLSARNPRMSDSDIKKKLPLFLKELEVEFHQKGLVFNQVTARAAAQDRLKKFIDRPNFRRVYAGAGLAQRAGPRQKFAPKS
jgi:hypothetical protein